MLLNLEFLSINMQNFILNIKAYKIFQLLSKYNIIWEKLSVFTCLSPRGAMHMATVFVSSHTSRTVGAHSWCSYFVSVTSPPFPCFTFDFMRYIFIFYKYYSFHSEGLLKLITCMPFVPDYCTENPFRRRPLRSERFHFSCRTTEQHGCRFVII